MPSAGKYLLHFPENEENRSFASVRMTTQRGAADSERNTESGRLILNPEL